MFKTKWKKIGSGIYLKTKKYNTQHCVRLNMTVVHVHVSFKPKTVKQAHKLRGVIPLSVFLSQLIEEAWHKKEFAK